MPRQSFIEVPKLRRPPISAIARRSPKFVAAVRGPRGSKVEVGEAQPTAVPAAIQKQYPLMTLDEYLVGWALEQLGMEWDVDFVYQRTAFGGRSGLLIAGGTVADWAVFALFPYRMVYVNGVYWHYERPPTRIERDLIILRKLRQEEHVIPCVIDDEDLRRDAIWVTRETVINLQDYSRLKGMY